MCIDAPMYHTKNEVWGSCSHSHHQPVDHQTNDLLAGKMFNRRFERNDLSTWNKCGAKLAEIGTKKQEITNPLKKMMGIQQSQLVRGSVLDRESKQIQMCSVLLAPIAQRSSTRICQRRICIGCKDGNIAKGRSEVKDTSAYVNVTLLFRLSYLWYNLALCIIKTVR